MTKMGMDATWATSHNALSRHEISAQLMNIKYSTYATKSSMKSNITIQFIQIHF